MTFLPIVVRELSVAARRRSTYQTRVSAAVIALCLLSGLSVIAAEIPMAEQGRLLFTILSVMAFAYCLFAGALTTADCLSEEKREGSLGLLFLTSLKGYDVVLGKLAASSLSSVYGLLAAVPMLALALLLGGVTAGELARIVAVLMNTLFFSLASGVFVSTISRDERKVMFGTIALILLVAAGPYAAAYAVASNSTSLPLAGPERRLLAPSPVFSFWLGLKSATGPSLWTREILQSLLWTHLLGWILLAVSGLVLPRVGRERPKAGRRLRWWEWWQRLIYGGTAARATVRRQLLNENPILWLSGRDRLKARLVWVFLGALALIWTIAGWTSLDLVFGSTVFLLYCAHAVLKIWLVSEVCSRWMEDHRRGALEALLTTPLSVAEIARGQGLALKAQFNKAAGAILALDLLLLCFVVLFHHDAAAPSLLAMIPAGMISLVADLMALRWVAMWLALASKSMSQALLGTWIRLLALPWIAYLAVYGSLPLLFRLAGRSEPNFPTEAWVVCWLAIGLGFDSLFGWRAKQSFLVQTRTIASEQFAPKLRISLSQAVWEWIRNAVGSWPRPKVTKLPFKTPSLRRRHAWLWSWLAVTLLGIGWFGWYRISLSRQIDTHLAATTKAGYPVTETELVKWHPPIPAEENAFELISQAWHHLRPLQALPAHVQEDLWSKARSEEPLRGVDVRPLLDDIAALAGALGVKVEQARSMPRTGEFTRFGTAEAGAKDTLSSPLLAQQKEALSLYVSTNRTALDILHQADRLRKARCDPVWSKAAANWGGWFGRTREALQLLRAEAVLNLEEERHDLAVQSLGALLNLTRSISREPFLQAQLIKTAGVNAAVWILESLLARHSLSVFQLEELSRDFGQLEDPDWLVRALAGERYLNIGLLQRPSQTAVAPGNPGLTWSQSIGIGLLQGVRASLGMRDHDVLSFLQTMEEFMEVARLPFPARLTEARRVPRPESRYDLPGFNLSGKLLPQLPPILMREAENAARLRLAETALAVERYRLKNNNRLPEQLKDLTPAYLKSLRLDPFDGKPLRYERRGSGYVLSSIGLTGEGGGLEWQVRPSRPGELRFSLERQAEHDQ